MNWKAHVACNCNALIELQEDFSRLLAVTYAAKVVILRKPCMQDIERLLLQTMNTK